MRRTSGREDEKRKGDGGDDAKGREGEEERQERREGCVIGRSGVKRDAAGGALAAGLA
jgi:hypothetical protein